MDKNKGLNVTMALCTERKLMRDGSLEIHCKLGLWSVSGCDHAAIEREAIQYFVQYLGDGEYKDIIENEIPPLDEIEGCDNRGCAGNRDGQCVMTGRAICYGYFKPESK